MPEVAEVAHIVALLKRNIIGSRILKIVGNDELIIQSPLDQVSGIVRKIGRHGKYFWITIDEDTTANTVNEGKSRQTKQGHLIMHLGMTGMINIQGVKSHMVFMEKAKISIENGKINVNGEIINKVESKYFPKKEVIDVDEPWPPRFSRFEILLDTHKISFTDPRRLGKVRYLSELFSLPPLKLLGPDYSKSINTKNDPDPEIYIPVPDFEEFKKLLIKKNKPIKSFLLDQGYFCGIGNWVSDEICYRSRIHPASNFFQFDDDNIIETLYNSILSVNQDSVSIEGDIRRMEGWLMVYRWGKGKKSNPSINGESINFETIGGRTAAFVNSQKLYKPHHKPPSHSKSKQSKNIKRVKLE